MQPKTDHTGQYDDRKVSDMFCEDLLIPKLNYHLECGVGKTGKRPALWRKRAAERSVQQLSGLL